MPPEINISSPLQPVPPTIDVPNERGYPWVRIVSILALLLLVIVGIFFFDDLYGYFFPTSKNSESETENTNKPSQSTGLFVQAENPSNPTVPENVTRSRYVKINSSLLLDENDERIDLPVGTEITFNLFDDVIYTGILDNMLEDSGAATWTGTLKDIDTSTFTLVYTAGLFAGNFGSPDGVYEVSNIEGDIYQVILIDQTGFEET